MAETIQPDLAPEGAVWVCLACGDSAKSKTELMDRGCVHNLALARVGVDQARPGSDRTVEVEIDKVKP